MKCVREVGTGTRTKASVWCYRVPVHRIAWNTRSLVRKERQVYWLLSIENSNPNSLVGVSGLPLSNYNPSSSYIAVGFGEARVGGFTPSLFSVPVV